MQKDVVCYVNICISFEPYTHPSLSRELSIQVTIGVGHAPHCYFLMCVDSNVAAGRLFGIPLRGTHSHAFVSSFMVGNYETYFFT